MSATDKSVTGSKKLELSACLELYKQGKPYRRALKKQS